VIVIAAIFCNVALESSHTICLNMIVKNEAPVIEHCLASVKHLIDYWVIVDTGSTDRTQEIIKKFLSDIPGELHERPWVNFAHNRNEAMQLAKDKGDYLLFIDADERLVFTADLEKEKLDMDCYLCFVRVHDNENEGKYLQAQRILLANNHLNWAWKGAMHENLASSEAKKQQLLKNVINFADSKEGHRSQDPLKGLKDAEVLEKALQEDPNNTRTVFFLAQSYEFARSYALALQNYQKRASMDGSEQEVFWSLFRIGQIQEEMQVDPETVIESYCRAFKNRPSRLEPLYYMALQYIKMGNAVASYVLLKSGLSFKPCEDRVGHETWIYDYGLLFEFAKSAVAVGRYDESCETWEKLLARSDLPIEIQQEGKTQLSIAARAFASFRSLKAQPQFASLANIEKYRADFKACPTQAAPLYHLAEYYAKNQNLVLAYAHAKAGALISVPKTVLRGNCETLRPSKLTQNHRFFWGGEFCNSLLPKEQWIYEYGLLNQWGNFAFALQKFPESIEAFESLLLKQNVPKGICMDAIRKIQQAKKIMADLNRFGLPSF
jgi:glycosyltransferase involved in cell wall biosynthesis